MSRYWVRFVFNNRQTRKIIEAESAFQARKIIEAKYGLRFNEILSVIAA